MDDYTLQQAAREVSSSSVSKSRKYIYKKSLILWFNDLKKPLVGALG